MDDVDGEEDDFEAIRQANIRENQATLERLGLNENALGIVESKPTPQKPVKRARPPRTPKETVEPSRKSRRLATNTRETGIADEDTDPGPSSSRARATVLRQLSPAPIPSVHVPLDGYPPDFVAPPPTRDVESAIEGVSGGTLHFELEPHFTPNLSPAEMMRLGSFGGTFFRAFHSAILHADVPEDYYEFPEHWFEGVEPATKLVSNEYDPSVNRYGVRAGQSLEDWERAGWIRAQDPRGWFQWYCRFYLGRRSADDGRQISRWAGVCGRNGRFRKSLVKKVVAAGGGDKWADASVAPVLRQTLQHWGYVLTEQDYRAFL